MADPANSIPLNPVAPEPCRLRSYRFKAASLTPTNSHFACYSQSRCCRHRFFPMSERGGGPAAVIRLSAQTHRSRNTGHTENSLSFLSPSSFLSLTACHSYNQRLCHRLQTLRACTHTHTHRSTLNLAHFECLNAPAKTRLLHNPDEHGGPSNGSTRTQYNAAVCVGFP